MNKIYIAILIIALALFVSCDEKTVDEADKPAKSQNTPQGSDATLTKPAVSAVRIRKEEPITFPKVPKHTYALKDPANFLTLDISDENTGQVRSTKVASGVIVVATFDGTPIESDPIDFLLYVANKKALQDEITKRLAEADGATANLNYIDTSDITDMGYMFRDARAFNQSLNNWNVSNVTTMVAMFYDATAFDQSLDTWNVSNVGDMAYMFYNATSFNQNISGWADRSRRYTSVMFYGATAMQTENKPQWAR